MNGTWERMLPRLEILRDLGSAITLSAWDQAVMMPPKGAEARARSIATLESIAHERLTDPKLGEMIEELTVADDLDDFQRAHVRVLKRDYDRATKIPPDLVRALAETRGLAYQAWTVAHPESNFGILKPHLTELVSLKKQEADAIGYAGERYDALLDTYEPDSTTAEVEALFDDLVGRLKPLADTILDSSDPRPRWLVGEFDERRQLELCEWLVAHLGFDVSAGRLDKSPHPFTTNVGRGDVRQTTRTTSRTALSSIYAAIHETGHALYEQGLPEEQSGLPAGGAASLGMHESQSRLWENQVGRGTAFTMWLLPHLKERFGHAMGSVTPEEFYRGVNHPERTFIRVDADEVTYNLHVVLRFELELELFRDKLEVSDLPEAWNEAMVRHLSIRPENDATGLLQDMHWSIGAFGYFPTYTLGTLYAAAFFVSMKNDRGDLDAELRRGETAGLLEWLREKVHSKAHLYPARELGERVLGAPLTTDPFIDYIRSKYSEISGAAL